MTEMINLPDPEANWAPAVSSTPVGAGNPARQCSVFQAATEPLIALALLAVDLDSVARRLRLTIEESWDEHGAVRAAFFVLDGTDFVVTHHERDSSGTYVWVRRSGPVNPAERTTVLLTALGVGTDAVIYSTWGLGADLSRVPDAWSWPVESHQRFWENFRKRLGMYVGRVTYEGVTAYLNGYDHASGGALLSGLRQWLADTHRVGQNLVWPAQVVQIVFPEGRPAEPWSQDEHRQAVAGLLALLEAFFEFSTAGSAALRREGAPAGPGAGASTAGPS
ncbi:hypothetical protein GCM10011583_08850 [Streptomyces camponoticapitis]|uniref:Uncharacterized protein n=1 Tax=Streptomyces camponoticapitis TaxID=1616125 RepID=A0ABQ2E378_9ACTN|nr:hypothetical protein GCM10011583_08850 [Streptomyces camponoticapitis]